MKDYRSNSLKYWDTTHKEQRYDRTSIRTDDWLDRFDNIIMNTTKPILDLGCGGGNDTKYLISKGKQVISCDQSEIAVSNIKDNFPEIYDIKCFNMLDGLPFDDGAFDVVIADLSLHYFDSPNTVYIISEIRRILSCEGYLMFRVNSVNDVNHGAGQGKEIEHHVYETETGTIKRFFDEQDIHFYFNEFDFEYLKEEKMHRYKMVKRLFTGCARNKKCK